MELEKDRPAVGSATAVASGPGENMDTDVDTHAYVTKSKEEDEDRESPFKNSTFNVFDAIFVLISMGLLVADLVTDMIVTCKYLASGDMIWGALTLGFILVPSIILQVFSVRWYLVDDDMSPLKWITHICQVGPLHRYVNLFLTGMEARRSLDPVDFERLFYQQSDVCMLRLFESFMESAPQVVLQLYIMVATNDENFWTGTSAAVSLFSLCWALGAYSRAHRKVRRDKKVVSWPGLVLQTMWRIGMVSSRVMALVLFASVFKAYIFLAVGIHWVGMMIWVHLQKTDFCTNHLEERLFNCVVAIIYVFCFFNLKEGKSRKRVLVFYSIMFIENTALLLVWYYYRTIGEWYNVAGFTIVFGGFGIGVLSMIMYYQYLHPRHDFSLCGGPKPTKEPSRSLDTTPSQSPTSTHGNLFSPELYRHGHSPSPKQQPRSDVNHNDNVDSPLARPLSQTSINTECVKENGISHQSGKDKGNGKTNVMGTGDSNVRKSKSESCVYYNEDETVSATVHLDKSIVGNASVMTNASFLASFRGDISGFGTDLLQRFDDWRDHSHYANHSVMSASSKSGNISRSLGSMLDQGSVSTAAATCVDLVDPSESQRETDPPSSPGLPQMPEITDSPNKIMTAYEAQMIYDSILFTNQHPHRNSKRKLEFKDEKISERARSKSGDAACHGKSTQRKVGIRQCNGTSGNRNKGPEKVVVTGKHVKDGYNVGNVFTSGQLSHTGNGVPGVGIKGRDSLGSHNTLTHPHPANESIETKLDKIHQDDKKKPETETINSQDVSGDLPIDLNGAKTLEGSNDNDLRLPINKGRTGFQNQNKAFISKDDVNSTHVEHVTQKGMASPMLRAALARDLFKAKERVKSSDKQDVHAKGCDKAMSVLGCRSDDEKGSAVDDLPVGAGTNPENESVKTHSSDSIVHVQKATDLKHTVLNSHDNFKQGHNYKNSPKGQYKSPSKAGTMFSSLSPKSSIFSTSQARFNGSHSPLMGERAPMNAGGSGFNFHGRSPSGQTNLKRVRSLKGSVSSESPSCAQGSSPGLGKGPEDEQQRTPIANLKGKIKRAMSIKTKEVSYKSSSVDPSQSIEDHVGSQPILNDKSEKALNTLSSQEEDGDIVVKENVAQRAVLVENQRSRQPKALSPQRYEGNPKNNRIQSPKNSGNEPHSVPTSILTSPIGKENRGFTPVLMNRNKSPHKISNDNVGMHSGSPQKTGREHISLLKGDKMRTPGKENRGYAPGTVKGSVMGHQTKEKNASPVGKKPPRRSLNRIPTNLVADNVARFDSPGK